MRIAFIILSLLSLKSLMAMEISYKKDMDYLDVKIEKNTSISVKSSGSKFVINVKDCNRAVVEKFISSLESKIKRIKFTEKSQNSISVLHNSTLSFYPLTTALGKHLKNIDQKLLNLKIRSHIACKAF